MTDLQEGYVGFPKCSSPTETKAACEEWGVARCPLKLEYWENVLDQCGFRPNFNEWILRTIAEGVDIGYRREPRDHRPYERIKTLEEMQLLAQQCEEESTLGRVVKAGKTPPSGMWFPRFFVSPTYTIPKKRVIGQP